MWPGPALLLLGLGLGLGFQPPPPGPRGMPGVLRSAPGLGQGAESSVQGGGTGGLSPRSVPRRASPKLPRRCPTGTAARVLRKVNSSDPAAATATVSCQTATCNIIQPVKINRKDQNAPLILSRDEEVTLNVTMRWNCPDAVVTRKSWLYFSVASVNATPDWNRPVLLPQVQVTKVSSLHIPKYALHYGVYVFNFTLTIIRWDPILPMLTDSDIIYIWVKKRPLKAVLPGDSRVTVKFSDKLILNGSMSYDPEADIPTEGLIFSWYCTTIPKYYSDNYVLVTKQDVCHPEQDSLDWPWAVGPLLTIPPETLRGDGIYYFRMAVRKQNRTAFADKTIHVLKGLQPKAHLLCIENCGPVLVVSDRFSLFLNCPGCGSQDIYSWSILSRTGQEVIFDWAGQAITRRNGAYLSVKAFAFRTFLENRVWVSLILKSWSGVTMTWKYPIVINHGPQVGKCKINPASGISMVTKFAVECSGFKDESLPLTYKIIASEMDSVGEISSIEENTLGTIVYLGTQPITPAFFLPVGMVTNHYNLRLYVQVYDSLGSFSQVTLQATVKAPTLRDSSKTILQQLLNFTREPTSLLSTSLQKQDWLSAGYLLYVVTSVLNNIKEELELQGDRARLLEHLVNQSYVLAMSTVDEICQSVMLIAKLTQKASGFSQAISVETTSWLRQANQALQAYQSKNKHLHSLQIEIVSTGILTSLSNLLKLINTYSMLPDTLNLVQSLSDTVLANKMPGSKTTLLRTSNFNMYVEKVENGNVFKAFRNESLCPNCPHVTLNTSMVPRLPPKAPISIMFCKFTDDPFLWLTYPENISTDVVGFRMTGATDNEDVLEITPDTAEVYLARKDLTFSSFNLTVGPGIKSAGLSKMTTGGISFEVDSRGIEEVLIHIVTNVTVLFQALVYEDSQLTRTNLMATFLVPHDIPPIVNRSDLFDPTCSVKEARVVCLSSSLLRTIAWRRNSFRYNVSVVLQAPPFVFKPTNKLVRIALFMVQCLDMYGIQSDWQQRACVLGEKTTWTAIHCVCRNVRQNRRQPASMKLTSHHLRTRFVTAKVTVVPNPVDLQLKVISIPTQNSVTFLVVVFIVILYAILAFWALHRDVIDPYLRDHVVILTDNDPFDTICYMVTIFTGSRCGSGTRANVFIQLMGTESTSDVHCLSHPYFKTLYRGSINTFLLTTKNDLGDIHSIRVWHDNSGKAPSWYLSRIKVEHLFNKRIWLFVCRRWLCVDTALDATFSVTNPDEPLKRRDFFMIDLSDKLGKNHMWFSVFSNIVHKPFNRLQRLSCCLAMLLSSLACNIMFFNLKRKEQTESRPRHIIRSMVIGIESALITIPVQLLITFFFTYSQKKPKMNLDKVTPQKHPLKSEERLFWKDRLDKWRANETKTLHSTVAKPTSVPMGRHVKEAFQTSQKHKNADNKASDTQVSSKNFSNNNVEDIKDVSLNASSTQLHATEPVKKKPQIILPRWCVYIAWFLVFATSGISSFFIVFYGLTYGYKRSVEWIFASFCSFCQSVFLIQPCKILLRSGTRTQKLKYCKNLSWSSKYHYTEIRLQELKMTPEEMEQVHQNMDYFRSLSIYQPITEDKIQILRRMNRTRRRSFLFLSYLVTHFIFLTLLLLLIFSLRHKDSFYYNQFIRHRFSVDLATVRKLGDIYTWLNGVFLPLLHNDLNPTFLPDSSSKILGLPLMRQVRAKPSNRTCLLAKKFVHSSIAGKIHCHPRYGIDPEDTKHYSSVWNKAGKWSTDKSSDGFTYNPPGKKWVYYSYGVLNTYGSGGYAFYFFPEQQMFNSTWRLKELEGKNWLDELTWAVIVELTTLNSDTSLMCSISVVFEVSPLGVVNSSLSVYSFSLADFNRKTSAEIYLYAAILIFFCAYIVDEGYVILQERASYIRSVYNLLNFSLKCMFALLIVLFFQKHLLATEMVQLYLTEPQAFIPFHAVSRVDHFVRIILAFLLFLTILKTLRYSRFFYNVRLAQKAIQTSLPGICHTALVVSMYSFMYVTFGYLVFGQHEWNYSNMIHATQTIFSYCVSAFQNTEFSSNKALGVLFLSSFMLVMICIFINLFQAVILSAYDEMKQPVYEEPSDEAEAVTYLCHRLKSGFGTLTSRSKCNDQSDFFVDILYGQPEKNTRRFLGLKARTINGKKMIYLVV